MIRVNNIHLSLDYDDKSVRKAVAKQLRIEEKSIKSCKIFRRSVDARKKDNIYFLTTVDAELNINEDKVCKKCGNAQIARKYEYNQMKFGNAPSPHCCRSRSGWIVCGTYSGKKRCKANSY